MHLSFLNHIGGRVAVWLEQTGVAKAGSLK